VGAQDDARTPASGDLHVRFRSMASDITLWVVAPTEGAAARLSDAQDVIERVAASCTRFDPTSALMRANAAGRSWETVPRECFDALLAARDAHVATDGLFDPRVLRALTAYGYDRSLPFDSPSLRLDAGSPRDAGRRAWRRGSWKPGFDADRSAVRVGREPVDLGGIGKGLAVRWATGHLRSAGAATLIEAGGDLMALGGGPDGTGWMVAVESPDGGADPVAVLRLRDRACATSSIRVRSWTVGETEVHHIIDPRTGRSADSGLRSVTVVGLDPALAEVWSKSLFVVGRSGIREAAESRDLAALWVDDDGRVGASRAMRPYIAWQVSRVA
jgi:thiamine biosynthesis lipoprotein